MSEHYTDEDVLSGAKAMCAAWYEDGEGWDDEDAKSGVRAILDAVAPTIAARALREQADRTIAEAVCCDEYEKFQRTQIRPKHPHHICYWGAAHAEALRARADEIEAS